MQSSLKRSSERYKCKVLARWRWMAARGVGIEQAALEIGVAVEDLRRWSARPELEGPLLVPVQIEVDAPTRREIVVVLAGGVRVEGLTLEDIAELARRLS